MTTSLDEKFGTVLGRRSKKRREKREEAVEVGEEAETEIEAQAEEEEERQRSLLRSLLVPAPSLFGALGSTQQRALAGRTPTPAPTDRTPSLFPRRPAPNRPSPNGARTQLQ